MVQRYTQENNRGRRYWSASEFGLSTINGTPRLTGGHYPSYLHADMCRAAIEQWAAPLSKESKLSRASAHDREVGGIMLNVTGINRFYYLQNFTDMRCKHSRVLSIIREQLHREPNGGDVYIVMSKNRRIVRMFTYDNRSYSLFEKKFVAGHQFMKVERRGDDIAYKIDWKDVVLLLENPIVKALNIR